MSELTNREKLQPSLLDRLTDEHPDKANESREQRVLSVQRLKEGIQRDLSWLLNSVNLASVQDLSDYPQVENSVLNYGMPDMAGHTASSVDVHSLQRILRDTILAFEPRLIRNSLKVKLKLSHQEMSHNTLSFDIEGEMWARPIPLRLYMKTEIDLESGQVSLCDYAGRGGTR